jgi:hypothetical protein
MDLVPLVITLIVLGRINGALLGHFGEWIDLRTRRVTFPMRDIFVSRGSAALQALGFVMLGFSSTSKMFVPSKSRFLCVEPNVLYCIC